ncbi:MAG TPA: hypothetical protein VII82_13540 [Polyangiaceae bacterium]
MAEERDAIAERLFAGIMAPLVLGGAIRPGHAIGARAALAFGEGRVPADAELAAHTGEARVRHARRLVPVDSLPGPSAAEWALAAAFHDLLQAANPIFDAPLRRGAATRVLDLALAAIERVPTPASPAEALARHTWFARAPEVARTDTQVRWWSGKREYLGVEPPERLQAWPQLRRVSVVRTPRPLLELAPIAVDRERLTTAVAELLFRTPLTDLATCARAAPLFEWRPSTLALVATAAGRTLALRSLARHPSPDVDGALGRSTRALLASPHRERAQPAVVLLADRALAEAQQRIQAPPARNPTTEPSFAQALGALAARRSLVSGNGPWSPDERASLIETLTQPARSATAREAHHLLESER